APDGRVSQAGELCEKRTGREGGGLGSGRAPDYPFIVGSDDDFHDALNAAIRSTEHYAEAKKTVARSKQLKHKADGLIESSRQLVDSSKRRIGKHGKPSTIAGRRT